MVKKTDDEVLKRGAIWLVLEVGLTVSETAQDICVHPNTIHKWLRQHKAALSAAPASEGPSKDGDDKQIPEQ